MGNLPNIYTGVLNELAELQGRNVAKVALKARSILVKKLLPSYEDRLQEMDRNLHVAADESDSDSDSIMMSKKGKDSAPKIRLPKFEKLKIIVERNITIDDVLVPFFYHEDK